MTRPTAQRFQRPTEAVNLLIKKVRRLGHGFRNFANYRLRLLLNCGLTWQTSQTARLRGAHHVWWRRAGLVCDPCRSQVGFDPSGSYLVALNQNGAALVWDVDPNRWKERACAVVGRPLTRDEMSGRNCCPAAATSPPVGRLPDLWPDSEAHSANASNP
jgi:hypothetical protein